MHIHYENVHRQYATITQPIVVPVNGVNSFEATWPVELLPHVGESAHSNAWKRTYNGILSAPSQGADFSICIATPGEGVQLPYSPGTNNVSRRFSL